MKVLGWLATSGAVAALAASGLFGGTNEPKQKGANMKTEQEWKQVLTPEQYRVLREKGTEQAYTGRYWNFKGEGDYHCAGCNQLLFKSDTKFDSGCGWPSFWDASVPGAVSYHDDYSFGLHRVEVTCSKCGGHLGHVFDDGPNPTGKRFCINSASLKFQGESKEKDSK